VDVVVVDAGADVDGQLLHEESLFVEQASLPLPPLELPLVCAPAAQLLPLPFLPLP